MKDRTNSRQWVWHNDGHLSDAALSALADGQDWPELDDSQGHLDLCEFCLRRLGDAAVASYQVQAWFQEAREVSWAYPWRVMAGVLVGLAVLFFFGVQSWMERLHGVWLSLNSMTPALVAALGEVVRSPWGVLTLWGLASVVLVSLGLAVAYVRPMHVLKEIQ